MNDFLNEAPVSTAKLSDYLAMFSRHRKLAQQVTGITLGVLLLLVFLWPPSYRSSATILIESQEIPQDFVRSTITSYAAEQLEVIRARVMTMQNIMGIVEKFGLYSDRVIKLLRSEKTEQFRKDVKLDLTSAEVMDPKSGRPMEATIAFTLSFDHENPAVAQKVVNEVVNLYLNENLRQRTSRSESATDFLKSEADNINKELSSLESRIAAFKQQYALNLPELYQYNLTIMDRSEQELEQIDTRIRDLQSAKVDLGSKLAQITPYAPKVGADGRAVLGDHDRLEAVEAEFREKSAVYSADHPDLRRLKREIQTLRGSLGVGGDSEKLDEQLREAKDKLHDLEGRYTADHPEIAKQKRVIAQLEHQWGAQSKAPRAAGSKNADNPAYLMVEGQLKSAELELQTLQDKRSELTEKLARYEMLMAEAPGVEQNYKQLTREYETAAAKYQDIKAKLREAEISKSLETERKGERFTLIEPPLLPDDPVSPNRKAFSVMAVIVALLMGGLTIAIKEAMDQTVRGERIVVDLVEAPLLAMLPYMPSEGEVQAKSRGSRRVWFAVAGTFIAALVLFHFLVKPLDVTWFMMMRRLGIG